jgi:putative N6-adenine-specific DNA methylase
MTDPASRLYSWILAFARMTLVQVFSRRSKIMSSEFPLTKRIKRHVIGRRRDYFAVTAPGFEALCLNELQSLVPDHFAASADTGGVAFKGRLQECYLANLNLSTANRILMRIETVDATSFSQLQRKLSEIPWELFLKADQVLQTHVTTRHCKLYHTGAISERILTSIEACKKNREFMVGDENSPSFPQNIFVRGVDDRFTVSIDSSGESLYKRGLKQYAGPAPLRETLAAASLCLAGYSGKEPLVDPMCGAGTYSLEAALMVKKIPPGWFREFAFMQWPAYRTKRFEYLKRQFEDDFVQPEKPVIFASDKDPRACRQLERCTRQFGLSDTVSINNADFFDLVPSDFTDQPGLITINPPYGRRIGTRQESSEIFQAICETLARQYKGWKLALITPSKRLEKKVPFKLRTYPLLHGGLRLKLMVGRIR